MVLKDMQNGLYCTGGYDWFSIVSTGNVYPCNALITRPKEKLGNIFENAEIRSSKYRYCPLQNCKHICDQRGSARQMSLDGQVTDVQSSASSSMYQRREFKNKKNPIGILWAPTWRCNYECAYCLPFPEHEEHTSNEWVKAFRNFLRSNDVDGGSLYVHGGEPLIYDKIERVFSEMSDAGFEISVSTNLSSNVYQIFSSLSPEQIYLINASLHPSEKSFSWEMFKSKVHMLKAMGYSVAANIVAHPDHIFLIPEYHEHFQEHDIPFMVIPLMGDWSGVSFDSLEDYPDYFREIIEELV